MGADFYESSPKENQVTLGVGDGTLIEEAIVDKNCRIGKNVTVKASGEDRSIEAGGRVIIRDGLAIVAKGTTLFDGWREV